jgi:hypothetical protein
LFSCLTCERKIYSILSLILTFQLSGYAANERFEAYKNDIVLDKTTNLLWVNTKEKPVFEDFAEAQEYCRTLEIDGIDGWEVPAYSQLLSLVNYQSFEPAIYPIFDTRQSSKEKISEYIYWTKDAFPDNRYVVDRNYAVSFYYGRGEETLANHAIRCVKPAKGGEKPFFHFTRDDSKRVVIDGMNEVMWLDDVKVYSNKYSDFNTTQQFCQNIVAVSFDDWRLPTINELNMLLDVSQQKIRVNSLFHAIKSERYFTSTPMTDQKTFPNYYWTIDFEDGQVSFSNRIGVPYCIRDIKEDDNKQSHEN